MFKWIITLLIAVIVFGGIFRYLRIFGIGKPPKIKIERLKHQDEGLYAKPNKRNKVYGETDLLE